MKYVKDIVRVSISTSNGNKIRLYDLRKQEGDWRGVSLDRGSPGCGSLRIGKYVLEWVIYSEKTAKAYYERP